MSTELVPQHKRGAGLPRLFIESSFLQVCDRPALIVSLLSAAEAQRDSETHMGHAYSSVYAGGQEEIIRDLCCQWGPQFRGPLLLLLGVSSNVKKAHLYFYMV